MGSTGKVICKHWGIPRSGQKFMGWEHSSEPLPWGIHVYGADAHQGDASRPAASTSMLGGLDRVTVRANLSWSRLLAVSGPFPVLRFRFVGFWSGEQARTASMNVGDIIPGEEEQTNRWRASWRHALPSTRTTATWPPPLRTKKYPSPSCAILITPSRDPDRLQRNWGEGYFQVIHPTGT
jgi:hypothetical protein